MCLLRSLPVLVGRVLVAGCASTRRGLLGTPHSGTPVASPGTAWRPGLFPPLLQRRLALWSEPGPDKTLRASLHALLQPMRLSEGNTVLLLSPKISCSRCRTSLFHLPTDNRTPTGCPLSPCLFNLVLTHLFYDVEIAYTQQVGLLAGVLSTPFPLWDLEYADDTTLRSNSAAQLTRLLHLLQHQDAVRGLHLHFLKCAHLKLHSTERIPFSPNCLSPCDCTSCQGHLPPTSYVPESDEVKYLGVYIDSVSSHAKNVSYRISQAVSASKLLKTPFWNTNLFPQPGNSRSHVSIMFTSSLSSEFLVLNLPSIIEVLTQPLQTALMSIYLGWHMTHSEWCVLLRSIPRVGWHSLATF